ncbi:hypothetical protein SACS_0782 [Parasaccharibacter apium]|uniref:Restriction endonuclease type IV Mrr domain-containing protein n=1 Tax=Parasaccharibacter apium TaxID=1510841 RepID=A0A7U7G5H6_9PROT|nr:restriction endonuclease [Parasaccharibacter apium]CDG33520.1 hypothetical protein SACS_0782 [Parasaccharibacter apium]
MAGQPDGGFFPRSGPLSPALHHGSVTPSFLPGHGIAILPADALLLGFFLVLFLQYRHRVRRRRKAWQLLCQLITRHQHTLAQRQQACLTENHYGVVDKQRWHRELDYFCQSILLTCLMQENLADIWPSLRRRTLRRISRVVKILLKHNRTSPPPAAAGSSTTPRQFTATMDPLDYERFCAGLLRQAGWQARTTPPGADQGMDIIAEQSGVRLVIQCKLYGRPVGNKAVQEIFTARQHRQAQYAAVVSNAGYTRPARQLAHATGVHLLHHSQLSTLGLMDLQPQPDLFHP